jgi:hypothetical protein
MIYYISIWEKNNKNTAYHSISNVITSRYVANHRRKFKKFLERNLKVCPIKNSNDVLDLLGGKFLGPILTNRAIFTDKEMASLFVEFVSLLNDKKLFKLEEVDI